MLRRAGFPPPPSADGERTRGGTPEGPSSAPGEMSRLGRSEPDLRDLAPGDHPGISRGPTDFAELMAWLGPPPEVGAPAGVPEPTPSVAGPAAAAQVAELVERWARRVSLGGDQRRGVARLEVGEGRYAGAELVVSAEGGHVSVELTLPEVARDSGLSERLQARLAQRGLSADVTVR